jgi:hypothetical protein
VLQQISTANDRDSCVNPMRASRERTQHALCFGRIGRLMENLTVEFDDGIRTKNDRSSMQGRDRLRLLQGEALRVGCWLLPIMLRLVDVCWQDVVAQTGLQQ